MSSSISITNAEHYVWGGNSDGWHLLKHEDVSIIQERVPPGGREVMHYHEKSRQFFYMLQGEGTVVLEEGRVALPGGSGLEIAPLTRHRFENNSEADVIFLVISVPRSHGDRVNTE
jgi:mannose-6-phosphate isomerase-like protein (cupin superfamily)